LGWLAIDLLKIYLKTQPTTVELAKVDCPGLNLLQLLDTTYPRIILIDAVQANSPPGEIFSLYAEDILEFAGMLSTHSIGIASVLAIAKAIGQKIKHIQFCGMQGPQFSGFDISPLIKTKLACLVNQVLNMLEQQ
jgi:hydrogenase maturation protease